MTPTTTPVAVRLVPVALLLRVAALLEDPQAEHPHDVSYLIEEIQALAAAPVAPAGSDGEMAGGDVIATVDPSRWDHPTAPQLAYAYGWNDALAALRPAGGEGAR